MSETKVETGTVKWFNASEGKRFGFIQLESGEEIFFHFNDGQYIEVTFDDINGARTKFTGKGTRVAEGKTRRLRDPKQDEVIVFERTQGPKGDKASPWGYNATWQRGEQFITDKDNQEKFAKVVREAAEHRKAIDEARANRPFYRVLEAYTSFSQGRDQVDKSRATVIWQGQDVGLALSRDQHMYYGHDDFNLYRWWEIRQPDGSWEECPDPRSSYKDTPFHKLVSHRWDI